ncbi:MAG: Tn3 family transposase [Solirubrobacteraceae bacterium]|nr:Tn3 family transposase [Solirubrobacteraceae bacterium]
MPVEFLSDQEAAAYGRFGGPPPRAELERSFFLDDSDRALIAGHRGKHNRLGFALQLTTVRSLGLFLADPLEVPGVVLDYLASQLEIADASCVTRYTERRTTRFEHAEEIKRAGGLRDFAEVARELEEWVDARAWTTGDGPKAIFNDAIGWLFERGVLLPGVTTLARLVARVRDEATQRLWDTLAGLLTDRQCRLLERLLTVADGGRFSDLERWRKGPAKPSGRSLERAIARVAEIKALGLAGLGLDGVVAQRRLVELARYGMTANARTLRRHPRSRRLATLLATVVALEAKATDDCLELLDLLMVTELLGKAERESVKEKARQHPRLARASAKLATAVEVLLDASAGGGELGLDEVWELIDAVVSRGELRAAVAAIGELVPPDSDDDAVKRAQLATRIATVTGFLKTLTGVVEFGATADARAVLGEMQRMPELLRSRRLTSADVDGSLIGGSWKRLVFDAPGLPDGAVDKNAYVFCVLTAFHRHLKRREIYANASTRWRDPRAQLLAGDAWRTAKPAVLTALSLPAAPDELLAEHARTLDGAYRAVSGRLAENTAVSLDSDGQLHIERLEALQEPASLIELRRDVNALLPRVDLPEVILEVMAWEPEFVAAFVAASGGQTRLADLHVTIAACLTAHALNIGYSPIVKKGVAALERDRLSHVNQNYLGTETYAPANGWLIAAQAGIALARAWGGGLVAGIDGMRFIVPVPSVYARPNRKYFGSKRGVTWLNMVNDQGSGLAAKVVSGTPGESLHMIDVIFSQDGGQRPDIIVADTGTYSDLVFGLAQLLGIEYRPELADMPDQRSWRIDPTADYGPLNTAARGRIDLDRVRRHWEDILRIVASIYTGTVRAYDVVRMLQRDGNPTPLGEGIASYGRIFKSLHILVYIDDDTYRRDIKGVRNLQEGRHSLAGHVFHGRKGQLYERYHKGMEDQLGALGLVLNCIVLWNARYMNAALDELRAQGRTVLDADVARLSPFVRRHLNVNGKYSFLLPELLAGLRALRNPEDDDGDGD